MCIDIAYPGMLAPRGAPARGMVGGKYACVTAVCSPCYYVCFYMDSTCSLVCEYIIGYPGMAGPARGAPPTGPGGWLNID